MINGNNCIGGVTFPRRLPVIKLGDGIYYFVDERLNELRDIENPHNVEKMEGSAKFYINHFGVLP